MKDQGPGRLVSGKPCFLVHEWLTSGCVLLWQIGLRSHYKALPTGLNYVPKAPPNSIILRVGITTYEFVGDKDILPVT